MADEPMNVATWAAKYGIGMPDAPKGNGADDAATKVDGADKAPA